MATAASTEDLWDRTRAARFLGVPERTLETWRAHGKGPRGVRVGRHLRYDPADVREWFESLKEAAR
jgi:predicted DNA-binding transcriptional regulator AlpA